MPKELKVLIIGASRGLGLALVAEWLKRGAQVIATVRTPSTALDALTSHYPEYLRIKNVDIADARSVRELRQQLQGERLDVLFVNAGICKANKETPATVDEQDFLDLMCTNALGPKRIVELYEDLVPTDGVVAVMSLELGSIAGNRGAWELCSASKAALNMLMKCFAARHPHDSRALLLVALGWVRTDMGTSAATLSIKDSIPFVVENVERSRGKAGLRFIDRHGKAIAW